MIIERWYWSSCLARATATKPLLSTPGGSKLQTHVRIYFLKHDVLLLLLVADGASQLQYK